MNRCIYLTESSEELKYISEEHVIPAGLGGIAKLSKGYVSDKANNLFSKYELKAMRHSLLTGNRIRHGSGKRGNQSVKREKNPKIQLLKDETSGYDNFLLGYLFLGNAYILPQIFCTFYFMNDTMSAIYVGDNYEVKDYNKYILEFRIKLMEFLLDENRSYTFIKDEFKEIDNTINIGFHRGKWYISSSMLLFDINNIFNRILTYSFNNIILSNENSKKESIEEKVGFLHRQTIDITSNSFVFIFVKTAFNALAYLMNHDFVLSSIFDNLRKDIIECNDMKPYIKPSEMHNRIFRKHINELPDKAHCVYIVSQDNVIYAYVTFYNEWHAHMILAEKYFGDNFVVGYVCDWQCKKEYIYN
ncbi:MAG: hypothetical protein N4A50_14780 [Vallitalea sp.]|jgi:hypothetical protein|nr:hypothetical protein [Vallitalea sp.]